MAPNPVEGLLAGAVPDLERSLRFRVQRQGVLAANLANADTPGYRRAELHFEDALANAMAQTDPRHLAGASRGPGGHRVEIEPPSRSPDRNGVDLGQEVLEVSRNAGQFSQQAAVLARLIALARIAATGEPR